MSTVATHTSLSLACTSPHTHTHTHKARLSPLQALVLSRTEDGAPQGLAVVLAAETEVLDHPHVREPNDFEMRVAPALSLGRRAAEVARTQGKGRTVWGTGRRACQDIRH